MTEKMFDAREAVRAQNVALLNVALLSLSLLPGDNTCLIDEVASVLYGIPQEDINVYSLSINYLRVAIRSLEELSSFDPYVDQDEIGGILKSLYIQLYKDDVTG